MKRRVPLTLLSPVPFLLIGILTLNISCQQNSPPGPTGPVTVVQVLPTPTPNPSVGLLWFAATKSAAFPARYSFSSMVFDNRMWITGGFTTGSLNDVWYSVDGVNWAQTLADTASPPSSQFPERTNHSSLTFNNLMWVIGGKQVPNTYYNDVWSSPDGTVWTNVLASNASPGPYQFSQRQSQNSVVFNGRMWVIGGVDLTGNYNDVWSSSDGVTWTNVLADNPAPGTSQFDQRGGQSALVYNNLLWIIGGFDGSLLNDVWSSPNGAVWTKVLANNASPGTTQFSQRNRHVSLVYDNLMWVIGGNNGSGPLNDVWCSSNGIAWTKVLSDTASPSATQFPQRYSFTSLLLNNEMWVLGGSGAGGNLNDVWETP